jgi:hypothetical protein
MAGEPIETTGMTIRQTDELTERVRSAILELSGQAEGEPAAAETSLA